MPNAEPPEMNSSSQQRYTGVAISLHWLIAAVILCTFLLGQYMTNLQLSPVKLKLYSYHKWIGVTIFLLVLARLAWRLAHRPPPPPASMPAWQHSAAGIAHLALYALTLAIPVSGWLMSSASGFQVVYLGVLPIPDLIAKSKETAAQLEQLHEALNWLMVLVVAMHVAAALKHHLVDRDDVLWRMLPFIKQRRAIK
jgi:cytochrome b561